MPILNRQIKKKIAVALMEEKERRIANLRMVKKK